MDELERLLIERACERLVVGYCHVIDHGEAARVADLFTEDGVWTSFEQTMDGRDAIARGFAKRQANKGRMSRHVCCNLLVNVIDAERATGVVYLTLYRHDGDPDRAVSPSASPSVVGEYRDEFVRSAGGWRFRRREVIASFVRTETN